MAGAEGNNNEGGVVAKNTKRMKQLMMALWRAVVVVQYGLDVKRAKEERHGACTTCGKAFILLNNVVRGYGSSSISITVAPVVIARLECFVQKTLAWRQRHLYTLSKSKRQWVVMYGDDRALVGIFFGLLEKGVFDAEAEKEEEQEQEGGEEEEKEEEEAMEVEQEGGGQEAQAEDQANAAALSSDNNEEVLRVESCGGEVVRENPRRVAL